MVFVVFNEFKRLVKVRVAHHVAFCSVEILLATMTEFKFELCNIEVLFIIKYFVAEVKV